MVHRFKKLHIFKEIIYAFKEKKVLKNFVHKRKTCSYQTRPSACRTFKRKKSLQAEKFHLSRNTAAESRVADAMMVKQSAVLRSSPQYR